MPPTASAEEIKASYRRLIAQYHPDRVATLAPEFRALAEEKSKELNAAYEAGMASAGRRWMWGLPARGLSRPARPGRPRP